LPPCGDALVSGDDSTASTAATGSIAGEDDADAREEPEESPARSTGNMPVGRIILYPVSLSLEMNP